MVGEDQCREITLYALLFLGGNVCLCYKHLVDYFASRAYLDARRLIEEEVRVCIFFLIC